MEYIRKIKLTIGNKKRTTTKLYPLLWFFIAMVLIFLSYSGLKAQEECSNWHLTNDVNLHFNHDGTLLETIDSFSVYHPSATISDKAGKILFYTDGYRFWDRNHNFMPHGNWLQSPNTVSNAFIIPWPGTPYKYLTLGFGKGLSPVYCNCIDLEKNENLGDVSDSNLVLNGLSSNSLLPRITVIKHADGINFWIIISDNDKSEYESYLLTSSGLSKQAVHSPFQRSFNQDWRFKPSLDGKLLADYSYWGDTHSTVFNSFILIYKFDNASGKFYIKNRIPHFLNNTGQTDIQGIEFSPDNSKLYVSSKDSLLPAISNVHSIYQFDLTKGDDSAIEKSRTLIYIDRFSGGFSDLQIGNNCKIYISRRYIDSLAVINNPNAPGLLCDFQINGVSLLGKKGGDLMLPQFIPNFFHSNANFTWDTICPADSVPFYSDGWNTGERWNFGDTASGSANFSYSNHPKHLFTHLGLFLVSHVVEKCTVKDSQSAWVNIVQPSVTIGNDTSICDGTQIMLTAGYPAFNTVWNTGDHGAVIWVKKTGIYSAVKSYGHCIAKGEIKITVNALPEPPPVHNFELCTADSQMLELDGGDNNSWLWENGKSLSRYYTVNAPGLYHVTTATINGCRLSDSVIVQNQCDASLYFPNIFTPEDMNGLNTTYMPRGKFISEYYIQIINRLGVILFETDDIKWHWDGKFMGKDMPEGVYFYYARYKYTGANGEIQTVKRTGNISLLR